MHLDEKWEQIPGETRSAGWGVLCGKEESHKGVGEVWNEREERQV